MDTTNLISWLPFDNSTTQDLCGNEWTVTGSPTIEGNALQLNGSSYLKMTETFAFTGQPFTVSCKFSGTSNTTGGAVCLWQMYIGDTNRFQISIMTNGTIELWKDNDRTINIDTSSSVLDGKIHHAECDFDGATWYFFLDGDLIGKKAHTCSARNYTLYVGANYSTGRKFTGMIDEFQIYDGVALHTEDFTPPTAEDYIHGKLALGYPVSFEFTADVQRKVSNAVEVALDVERTVKVKWRYVNAGDADDLIVPSTILVNLLDYESKTRFAFYQTARQKCFDLPATDEIWMKFDVYFDGSTQWQAFNNSNGYSGIASWDSSELDFIANGNLVRETDFPLVANSLQTVLLHMISDSSAGVIEAWVDGNFIYRYTGDVNHGQDFADIYLRSGGSGTFFSNVIISNYEIGLGEECQGFWVDVQRKLSVPEGFQLVFADVERKLSNVVEFTADVERRLVQPITAPIVVPLIDDHFNHYVQSLTLFNGNIQRIVLPKKSKAFIRTAGAGVIKVFSDTDTIGKIAGIDFSNVGNMYAVLDNCEKVFIELSSANTSQQVIRAFIKSLCDESNPRSGITVVDNAIKYCTNGTFLEYSGYEDYKNPTGLVEYFYRDLATSTNYIDFLRDYCDIILDNPDTGAITGADASGDSTKTAESIVPENIPVENWVTPTSASVTIINGLNIHWSTIGARGQFTTAEKHILAGLNSVWIEQSLNLIEAALGLNFTDAGAFLHDISVSFEFNASSSAVAYVVVSLLEDIPDSLELVINMHFCNDIDVTSVDGDLRNGVYLDRILAHELTHAVMAANMRCFSGIPPSIREGLAELVHGIDDLRRDNIIACLTTKRSQLRKMAVGGTSTFGSDLYAAGYMFLRYMMKQGKQNLPPKVIPNEVLISNLFISDGDYTRQIFYPDLLCTLIKSTEDNFDVEFLDVVPVEFLADLKRDLLARLILFPRNSEDFFADENNPFLRARSLRSATPPNTAGLQSFEVTIAEQQVTDQVKFTGVIPFDIMQQVSGQYFDYIYNMRVERVQQQGILFSCDCCSDIDKLLYTQISYKIPPMTWYYKVDGEIVGEIKTVEVETHYPPASEHVNRIANALGLSPVMQFDNYQTTVLTDDLGGVTYNDLIRDVFGWTSRVPTQLINVYIREGKLFVIERGHESHSVDISAADKTLPIITKELVRTAWGSSITSTTTTSEANIPYFVPADKVIDTGGDTSGDTSGGEEKKVREVSTRFIGNNYRGYTTYSYNYKGLLVHTYTYTDKDVEDSFAAQHTNTNVNYTYDDDGTMIKTTTETQSYGPEGDSSSKSIDEKGYVILPNGEKFLAWEYTATYQNSESITISADDLVDSKYTTHAPSRVGQNHITTITSDGDVAGAVGGQNTGDDRVTPFRNKQAKELINEWDNKVWDSALGEWKNKKIETGSTIYGLPLYDSSFPIHNQDKLIQVTNAIKDLNRKTRETVNVTVYDLEHLIDFNDKIILDGAEYFLVSNTARTTPRIKFEQNLTLVRWY